MRIFKNKAFHRWLKEVGLSDNQLKNAAKEISNGLYEAHLGGNVFKKRVALDGVIVQHFTDFSSIRIVKTYVTLTRETYVTLTRETQGFLIRKI